MQAASLQDGDRLPADLDMTGYVLVVEDNDDIREMMALALQLAGASVACAANGREALALLKVRPAPNLILLDLMMPVMNGWEFRERQARDPRFSSIPVVVVTAAGPRDDIPAITADGWLSKPVDFDRLLATIQPLCQRP